MRKKRVITKVTAMLLSFAVVFSMIPGVVFADTGADTATVITTAEQFAKMDAGGNYKLGKDITVTTPYANDFSGTFDGAGHTVTLNATSNGVFVKTGNKAEIKNLAVKGSVYGGKEIGGLVGINAGIITMCKNEADIVSNDRYVGGIAGKNTGSINDCYNVGNINNGECYEEKYY